MDMLSAHLDEFMAGPGLPVSMGVLALLVAVAAVWSTVAERMQIRRRAQAGVLVDMPGAGGAGRDPQFGNRETAAKMLAYVARHFVPDDKVLVARLKRRLMQAGFLKPSAVALFFVARGAGAVLLGVAAALLLPMLYPEMAPPRYYLSIGGGLVGGYLLPSFWLDRRIGRLAEEHRYGFPDFMDLMVVCADSGLAMESALERVGRELAATHPSLSANLAMATLEMRAGRTLGEALEHLGDRLAIDEARSFATLLQQSEELGSSMTEALRVYSDDMRHARLMRAEEKAYALPAKLVIPLGIFIFPIVMVVALMPVVIRVKYGLMGG